MTFYQFCEVTAMDGLNKDMLLGSAIQLIKDIERITFLGERSECVTANHMAKAWLKCLKSSCAGSEEDNG